MLRITIYFSVIASIFGYTLSAIKSIHKPTSTFKTVMLIGIASNALQILSSSQSFQINSYLKLIEAKKIKFKALKLLPRDHCLIDELNSALDNTINDLVASKYLEPNEISSLIKKQTQAYHFFI